MHTDVATGDIHSDLSDSVGELERVITELQDISATLRGQSEWSLDGGGKLHICGGQNYEFVIIHWN